MSTVKPPCPFSRVERAVLRSGKLLLRLAVIIAVWRVRSVFRLKPHIGGIALWMIGLAATGLGLILHASLRFGRLRVALATNGLEREVFDLESFGAEVATWAGPKVVEGGRMIS